MNTVILFENSFYFELTSAEQEFFESTLRRIPGTKLERVQEFQEIFILDTPCSINIPIFLPDNTNVFDEILNKLQLFLPSPKLFGIVFSLFPQKGFTQESLNSLTWVEILDAYYNQAIPTEFVFWGSQLFVNIFHIVAANSSVFRHIDNLQELQRLTECLQKLETETQTIIQNLVQTSQNR